MLDDERDRCTEDGARPGLQALHNHAVLAGMRSARQELGRSKRAAAAAQQTPSYPRDPSNYSRHVAQPRRAAAEEHTHRSTPIGWPPRPLCGNDVEAAVAVQITKRDSVPSDGVVGHGLGVGTGVYCQDRCGGHDVHAACTVHIAEFDRRSTVMCGDSQMAIDSERAVTKTEQHAETVRRFVIGGDEVDVTVAVDVSGRYVERIQADANRLLAPKTPITSAEQDPDRACCVAQRARRSCSHVFVAVAVEVSYCQRSGATIAYRRARLERAVAGSKKNREVGASLNVAASRSRTSS
jgi:hypothetical protein